VSTPLLPAPDERESPPTDSARNNATCMALVGLLAASGVLIGLVAMIFPSVLVLVALPVVIGFLAVIQYYAWGKGMLERHRREEQESQ